MNALKSSTAFQTGVEVYPVSTGAVSAFSGRQHRIHVFHTVSPWMSELEDRFNEVVGLPLGWDGYDGQPVSFTTARFAALIIERLYVQGLRAPSIVPGADGSMQIEWHLNGYDVELDVLGPLNIEAYRYDHVSGEEQELHLESDVTQIAGWIEDLSTGRNFQAQVPAPPIN